MAGLVAGLFLGIVGRIVMRILALAENMIPTFAIEASPGVLLIGVIIGLVSGLIYAVLVAFLPPFRDQGVAYGLIIMGVLLLLMPDLIQGELANAENGQAGASVGRRTICGCVLRVWGNLRGCIHEDGKNRSPPLLE